MGLGVDRFFRFRFSKHSVFEQKTVCLKVHGAFGDILDFLNSSILLLILFLFLYMFLAPWDTCSAAVGERLCLADQHRAPCQLHRVQAASAPSDSDTTHSGRPRAGASVGEIEQLGRRRLASMSSS